MATTHHTPVADRYSLGRTEQEYERLRVQARIWEAATGRVFDQVGLAPGARCLDAGCGPGETMRLIAQRVGPTGRVLGIDIDAALGAQAEAMLIAEGHRQCRFLAHDITGEEPVPGGPFDLVYARLLLFHLPARVAVLARLWDSVAPGGHLVVQDYDLGALRTTPTLDSFEDVTRQMNEAFEAAGCDIHAGSRLPYLFAEAGVGEPDGTDVAGLLSRLDAVQRMLDAVYRSLLPSALGHGLTTEAEAHAALRALGEDAVRYGDRPGLWPLLIGAWKCKAPA